MLELIESYSALCLWNSHESLHLYVSVQAGTLAINAEIFTTISLDWLYGSRIQLSRNE